MKTSRELKMLATQIRIGVVEAIGQLGFGHIGGALSICDALAVLYGNVMRFDPKNPDWPQRDKLVCSKGHAGPAVYAALALAGYFPYADLLTLNQPGTRFPSHCDRRKTPGVDMTTGSLGQGASLAAGMALGDRLKKRDSRVFLFVGDGELNEGQVWEAAMFAAAHELSNLYWLIDYNKKQLDGPVAQVLNPFDIEKKFSAFGFDAVTVSGNDVDEIQLAIENAKGVKPRAIVLDTVKGAGVREVETTANNHSMTVSQETRDRWLQELRGEWERLKGEALV